MLISHLKLAWKVLLRRKGFTAVSLFTIAATLLVVTVAAAMLDSVFGHRPPESKLDRAVGIYAMGMYGEHGGVSAAAGYGFLDRHMRGLPGVEETAFFTFPDSVVSYVEGRKVDLFMKRADGAFWRVFDFRFLEGGPFTDDDERDRNFVAVINADTRDKLLGGPPAVGRWIEVDGQRFQVTGVVENLPIVRVVPAADVYVPISTAKSETYKQEWVGNFEAVFVARSASDLPAIRAEIDRRIRTAEVPNRDYRELRGGADTKFEAVSRLFFESRLERSHPGRLRTLLAGFAVLFMLLPAINLTNLNVSRIAERMSEIGVRRSFGARKRSLVAQFLLENLVVTMLGGALGFALSGLALAAINASGVLAHARFRLDFAVAGWTLLAALVFGILSGVWPAWRMARLAPIAALSGGPR